MEESSSPTSSVSLSSSANTASLPPALQKTNDDNFIYPRDYLLSSRYSISAASFHTTSNLDLSTIRGHGAFKGGIALGAAVEGARFQVQR